MPVSLGRKVSFLYTLCKGFIIGIYEDIEGQERFCLTPNPKL